MSEFRRWRGDRRTAEDSNRSRELGLDGCGALARRACDVTLLIRHWRAGRQLVRRFIGKLGFVGAPIAAAAAAAPATTPSSIPMVLRRLRPTGLVDLDLLGGFAHVLIRGLVILS